MSTLLPLAFENRPIRVIDLDGGAWFVAVDVCRILELKNSRDALGSLDVHQKRIVDLRSVSQYGSDQNTVGTSYGIRGNPNVTVVSEGGLYKLVARSQMAIKPGTVQNRFANWLFDDVVPNLRKYGFYAMRGADELESKRERFRSLPETYHATARARAEAVQAVEAMIARGHRIGVAVASVAQQFNVSAPSLRRWRERIHMVAAHDTEAALAPRWQSGPRGMIASCHPAALGYYTQLCATGMPMVQAYAETLAEAHRQDWHPIPSNKTLSRTVRKVFPELLPSR